jgi:chitin synthase
MDRRGGPYRSPSPGYPVQPGYQLEENPYGRQPSNLDMPMAHPQRYGTPMDRLGTPSDHLALNQAVSTE